MNLICCASCCCKSLNKVKTEQKKGNYRQLPTSGDDNEPIVPQYDNVPLEKLFHFEQPRIPLSVHPQIEKDLVITDQPTKFSIAQMKPSYDAEELCDSCSTSSQTHMLQTDSLPRIDFILFYDIQTFSLTVFILEGCHLPARDRGGTSDPFITLFLLPHKEVVFRTKTCYKNLHPIFNEMFTFHNISLEEIHGRTLVLRVFDEEKFTRDDLIGIAKLPLHKVELHGTRISVVLNETDDDDDTSVGKGDIQLSLWYNPSVNELSGLVIRATNLKKMDIFGLSDPYVVIRLIHNQMFVKKWESKFLKKTLSPVFNQDFTFDVADMDIQNVMLKVVLKDKDVFCKDDMMGYVDFGVSVTHTTGRSHWKEMIDNPFHRITNWHSLI